MNQRHVTIIGAGLAGSEAAWQIATRGMAVQLYEMRPEVMTKAHRSGCCAELVCSNSLRGAALSNAVGLLKEELRRLGSLIMQAADASRVPAGGALAVDRELFSSFIDEKIRCHPLIKFEVSEVREIPRSSQDSPVIVATGPLTSPALAKQIELLTGVHSLSFFDAISPIVLGESIDTSKVFRASRYGKGGGEDYLNIPLSEAEYYEFVKQVNDAEKFGGHDDVEADCIDSLRPFEGCMPIEEMAARGADTLLFGPLKPVGLRDPHTGKRPFAVVQLRQDNRGGQLWSMVGFQTRMKHGEQKRVFSMLPGLEQAEFVRLGSVHRNTFIESPRLLDASLQMRNQAGLFFAGQITGVEGYVESTCAGLLAGLNAWRLASGQDVITFPADSASGALLHYISDPERKNFQPMNISFGLIPCYLNLKPERHRGKDWRRLQAAEHALELIETFKGAHELGQDATASREG